MKLFVGWDKAASAADGPPPLDLGGPALADLACGAVPGAGPTLLAKCSANAAAASLPEGRSKPYSSSATLMLSPTRTSAVEPGVLSAASEKVTISFCTSGLSFANWQTIYAVIIF